MHFIHIGEKSWFDTRWRNFWQLMRSVHTEYHKKSRWRIILLTILRPIFARWSLTFVHWQVEVRLTVLALGVLLHRVIVFFNWIITNSMAYGTRRVLCRIHKGSPVIPFLSRINPTPRIPISLRSILILFSYVRLGLPKGLFPECVPVNILKALLPSFILAIWSAHLSLLDLMILIILGERYKLWSSSLLNNNNNNNNNIRSTDCQTGCHMLSTLYVTPSP